ncbi:MAG: hypothetical protein QM647_02385 [Asticcacaulis sp.]|uniref:hypothetical protein n=1 Tax=Asticcacaulis sp. TaxID=1872648 RepID=UPI0039E2B75E
MKTFVRLALCLSLSLMPMLALGQETAPPPVEPPETVITVTESANLRALADQQGYDGHTPVNYLFIVPAKTNIMGKPGGGTGIDTGKWPEDASVVLLVRGNVYGGGGNGSDGGDTPMVRDGSRGGDAIFVQSQLGIVISPGGSVKAGGGGGAGADGVGSGGGGGFPNGAGGRGGSALQGGDSVIVAGNQGYYGTPGGGGRGGQRGNTGGDGGNAAMPGQSLNRVGGGEGFAIRTNGNDVVLDNRGDLRGQIG